MPLHTIASYNMSFASDQGDIIGSEKHFIEQGLTTLGKKDTDKRALWKNAAKLVKDFWTHEKNASAMGLQEMNQRSEIKKKDFEGGMETIIETLGSKLAYKACGQRTPFGVPTLLTIWDPEKLGIEAESYCADLNYDPPKQTGRPISIVKTDRGFVLINLHAPNSLKQSKDGMKQLRKAINDHLTKSNITVEANKLFIMGDFNDPLHGINDHDPLKVAGHVLKTGSKDIKSCCFNFNSSCDSELFNKSKQYAGMTVNGVQLVAEPMSCYIRKSSNPAENQNVPKSAPQLLGDRGLLKNYRFTGDYVLGHNVETALKIYRPESFEHDGFSLESDHEMVYATFSDAQGGGKRRKTRRNKKRSTRKRA